MLLRRITEHVKTQNWFAVAIDFIIVVVGIFVGLQVSNWNEASRAATTERAILEQLKSEFVAVVDGTRRSKLLNDEYVDATIDVLRVIKDGVEPKDKTAFLQVLSKAGRFGSAPIEPTTLTELISSGRLSTLSSPGLRRALIRFHELSVNHQRGAHLVLDRISTPNDGFHDAIYVNPDLKKEGEPFLYHYDWKRLPNTREQFQVLLYGKLSLSNNMDELIVKGEAVLAEIAKAQK